MSTQPSSSLDLTTSEPPLIVVVGSGGVGKTTLAASLGLVSADAGHDTLVMTFDPSLRLKDALGITGHEDHATTTGEVAVDAGTPGSLDASLLDARATFDRLVEKNAPDAAARDRILKNPFYDHLAGHLGGILEYMAVERLYEVASSQRYGRVILDTPPTRQALDFLEAPERVVSFLDSGALKIALKPWFDEEGHLKAASSSGLGGFMGRQLEGFLDRMVGMRLLRGMSEFFQAFEPLFDGFRERAQKVQEMLAHPSTRFVLVTGPGDAAIPDTLFFARRLQEAGYHLGPVVVNRIHPRFVDEPARPLDPDAPFDGRQLFRWLGERHHHALGELRRRLTADQPLAALSVTPDEPTELADLAKLGQDLHARLKA